MTTDNHDPFALGGDQGDNGDARVRALFREWLEEYETTDRLVDDQPECDAALDRAMEIERTILATPAGPAALAIKSFLYLRNELPDWVPQSAMVRHPALFEDGHERSWEDDFFISFFRDAAAQVPELAELVAPIIHEDAALIDADIDIQWCRAVANMETYEADPLTRRAAALDRIARIAAKTPRGETIKLKHAPMGEIAKAELRARAEALAAEYAVPLPHGDAGLIEAERRLREIRQQTRSLYREFFKIDAQTEKDIIIGIIDPVRYRLSDFIEQTRPAGLAGAAVKLRLLTDDDVGIVISEPGEGDIMSLKQVAEFVEREVQS